MIITPPEDQAVALGENVTFTCIASGTTPPSIVWAQIVDGNTIPISNDVEMLEMDNTVNSTLTISDVKQDYFGTYQCIAGEIDVASFTLYEAGKQHNAVTCSVYMWYIQYIGGDGYKGHVLFNLYTSFTNIP